MELTIDFLPTTGQRRWQELVGWLRGNLWRGGRHQKEIHKRTCASTRFISAVRARVKTENITVAAWENHYLLA